MTRLTDNAHCPLKRQANAPDFALPARWFTMQAIAVHGTPTQAPPSSDTPFEQHEHISAPGQRAHVLFPRFAICVF